MYFEKVIYRMIPLALKYLNCSFLILRNIRVRLLFDINVTQIKFHEKSLPLISFCFNNILKNNNQESSQFIHEMLSVRNLLRNVPYWIIDRN